MFDMVLNKPVSKCGTKRIFKYDIGNIRLGANEQIFNGALILSCSVSNSNSCQCQFWLGTNKSLVLKKFELISGSNTLLFGFLQTSGYWIE